MTSETHKQRVERKKRERAAFQDQRAAEIAALFDASDGTIEEEPELPLGQGSVKGMKMFLLATGSGL